MPYPYTYPFIYDDILDQNFSVGKYLSEEANKFIDEESSKFIEQED